LTEASNIVIAKLLKDLSSTLNDRRDFTGSQREGGVNRLLFHLIAALDLTESRIEKAQKLYDKSSSQMVLLVSFLSIYFVVSRFVISLFVAGAFTTPMRSRFVISRKVFLIL